MDYNFNKMAGKAFFLALLLVMFVVIFFSYRLSSTEIRPQAYDELAKQRHEEALINDNEFIERIDDLMKTHGMISVKEYSELESLRSKKHREFEQEQARIKLIQSKYNLTK